MSTPPAPLALTKRLAKGSPLTPLEMDNDLTFVEVYVNYLLNQFGVALNADGTLKDGSVATSTIQNRAVTLDKLAFLSQFYAEDTGSANAMVIAFGHDVVPGLDTFKKGLVFFVKAAAGNTGNVTLKVDATSPEAVRQYTAASGLVELVQGNIIGGNIYCIVSDGTQYICLNPTPPVVTAVRGVLHRIPPVTLLTYTTLAGGTGPWSVLDVTGALATLDAKSVLLAADVEMESTAPTGSRFKINVRPNSAGGIQQLLYCISGTSTGTGNYQEGWYEMDTEVSAGVTHQQFEYQTVLDNSVTLMLAHIYVVGYVT